MLRGPAISSTYTPGARYWGIVVSPPQLVGTNNWAVRDGRWEGWSCRHHAKAQRGDDARLGVAALTDLRLALRADRRDVRRSGPRNDRPGQRRRLEVDGDGERPADVTDPTANRRRAGEYRECLGIGQVAQEATAFVADRLVRRPGTGQLDQRPGRGRAARAHLYLAVHGRPAGRSRAGGGGVERDVQRRGSWCLDRQDLGQVPIEGVGDGDDEGSRVECRPVQHRAARGRGDLLAVQTRESTEAQQGRHS